MTLSDRRSVSTWSLHRTLGNYVHPESAANGGPFMSLPDIDGGMTLLEVIPEVAARGYASIQICHFHLESREPAYLATLRQALTENTLPLDMLLIDDGDLTTDDIEDQMAWISEWLTVAETLEPSVPASTPVTARPRPNCCKPSGNDWRHWRPSIRMFVSSPRTSSA
ncbi:MAG: hypothetical protein M9909_09395 [Thermomicrobiales bacterium]|nr:hypothetical protein [Thermomicrobiales bacterium]